MFICGSRTEKCVSGLRCARASPEAISVSDDHPCRERNDCARPDRTSQTSGLTGSSTIRSRSVALRARAMRVSLVTTDIIYRRS